MNDIESSSSNHHQITFGVPDAPILGPDLFNFYVCDMQAMSQLLLQYYNMFYCYEKVKELQSCTGIDSDSFRNSG